jgi:hypothetical protein
MRRFRTLFPTLAAACLAAAPAAAQTQAPDRDPAALRQMAEDLAYRYLDGWSSGNAQALADVQALYGPKVNFYGRVVDRRALFEEKRRFGRRWPVRRYEHRPGTLRVSCEPATQACLVKSIIDWRAASPARGAVSRGSSTFELGIAFAGPRPVVLFERGQVIGRGQRQALRE